MTFIRGVPSLTDNPSQHTKGARKRLDVLEVCMLQRNAAASSTQSSYLLLLMCLSSGPGQNNAAALHFAPSPLQ
jgi:hypothetical protein